MRDFWTFIGGVPVGILAVIDVFALEEDDTHRSIESHEDEVDKLEDAIEEDDERLIVRTS